MIHSKRLFFFKSMLSSPTFPFASHSRQPSLCTIETSKFFEFSLDFSSHPISFLLVWTQSFAWSSRLSFGWLWSDIVMLWNNLLSRLDPVFHKPQPRHLILSVVSLATWCSTIHGNPNLLSPVMWPLNPAVDYYCSKNLKSGQACVSGDQELPCICLVF